MIDIYKSSAQTFVWLGEGDAESDVALQFSRRVAFIRRHRRLQKFLPKNGILSWNMLGTGCTPEALSSLASRSYWSRLWTIQQFTASAPIIFCGSAKPTSGVATLEAIDEISRAQPWEDSWPQFKGRLHRRYVGFNEEIDGIPLLSSQYVHLSRMSSSDERDKVFALKGLFRNALKDLVIDYNKPTCDIYAEATRITIINEKSLAILQFVAHSEGEVRFPSWAVDWNFKHSYALAHQESSPRSHGVFRFSVDGKKLHLVGRIVGEISRDISDYFKPTAMKFVFKILQLTYSLATGYA
ncbi:hypothetical protein ONS95_002178 [Cadophora gregata]|uniref:uncharacterized protein n=1 Tax=Cadophora gregata TaxID=51156 RepID=UPI0026DBABCC|nr:uncharacterized protein ONS95_002178 [Cadophora gregata]KAK0109486.1 hypothetical protein ONS95_002178 [Cadophora gregata]KAK0110886.1 hypothetical protein ONS96_002472 [Cadophora gregata f. sp. sojae]